VVTRDLAFPIGGCAPLLSKRPGDSLAIRPENPLWFDAEGNRVQSNRI